MQEVDDRLLRFRDGPTGDCTELTSLQHRQLEHGRTAALAPHALPYNPIDGVPRQEVQFDLHVRGPLAKEVVLTRCAALSPQRPGNRIDERGLPMAIRT